MKRWVAVAGIALCLLAARVEAVEIGIGLVGGATVPLAQSDNASGGQLGVRLPILVTPLLTVEPFFANTALSRVEATFAGRPYNRRGLEVLSWGATLVLGGAGQGPRMPFYPYVGFGWYHSSREGSTSSTDAGYTFGAGWARKLPYHLTVNARSGMAWINTGGAARRFLEFNAGFTVPFGFHDKEEVH